MRKTKAKIILNSRGSAIIMALVIISILILLGLAVATLSMGTLINNTEDSENNEAYYAAEAGVNSAIEHIKYEVSSYYSKMLESSGEAYKKLYDNFFADINKNADLNFVEPSISGITTSTVFSKGSYKDDICEFLISCEATSHDGTGYVINGSVYVKRVNIVSTSGYDWLSGGDAIKAGGTLDLAKNNSAIVNGGNIHVGDLKYEPKNNKPITIWNGELIVEPGLSSSMADMLSYPSYTDPSLTNVDLHITKSSKNVNLNDAGKPPITVTTDEGINLQFNNTNIPEGIVHVKGDVKINNAVVYGDIYCDGDLSLTNASIRGDIYCRGDININNINLTGTIYCDGFITATNCSLNTTIYSGDGIYCNNLSVSGNLYSSGQITITNYSFNGIIYSSDSLEIGSGSIMGVLFSAGDLKFLGSVNVFGAVMGINDIYFKTGNNKSITVSYSKSYIDQIVKNPNNSFFFGSSGEPELEEDVFIGQNVSAQGRVN